jgi:hypothetical protein
MSDFPALLMGTKISGTDPFRLTFTNTSGASFSVWSSTNLMLPFSNWIWLGFAREITPGEFQFSDLNSTNRSQEFYRIRSP